MRYLDLIQEVIFTFIKELSSSVLDYALASEGIINNILDFNIGVE